MVSGLCYYYVFSTVNNLYAVPSLSHSLSSQRACTIPFGHTFTSICLKVVLGVIKLSVPKR